MKSLLVTLVSGDELRASARLQEEIRDIVRPSYEDPSAILRREFADCTQAYLGRGADERLVCFYMTAWERIEIDGQNLPTVHLGLSATRQDTKNTGAVGTLYKRCLQDAAKWEHEAGVPLILWSTTASPTVFLAVTHYLASAEPVLDGSYSATGSAIAQALRKHLGAPKQDDNESPFVLKGIAKGTRYSEDEQRRIAVVSKRKKFTLFHELGVDESINDRLLFVARVPESVLTHD